MPKKTRFQKKMADSRRKQGRVFLTQNTTSNKLPQAPHIIKTKKTSELPTYTPPMQTEYEKRLFSYTMSDLRKTLIVISFLFILEFGIFYANLRGVRLENITNLF